MNSFTLNLIVAGFVAFVVCKSQAAPIVVPETSSAIADSKNTGKPAKKVTYKKGKDLSFDSQVVEGNVYRPELSVVTGDTELGGTGVLRLRTELKDHILLDMGGTSL